MEFTKEDYIVIYQCLCDATVKGAFAEKFVELKAKVQASIEQAENKMGTMPMAMIPHLNKIAQLDLVATTIS